MVQTSSSTRAIGVGAPATVEALACYFFAGSTESATASV